MHKNLFLVPALLAFATAGSGSAQTLFATAGESGSSVSAFTVDPLSFAANYSGAPNSFAVLQMPAGTRFYTVGRSATDTVVALDGTFPALSPSVRLSLGAPAVAAALSPDARRLFVLTNILNIIDTATNSLISTAGIDVGESPTAVVGALDGSRMYILSPTSLRVTAVATETGAVQGTVAIPSTPSGIAVAPNGLIYVSASGAIYVVDGRSMTIRNTINIRGQAGPLVFSPDGRLGVAVNQTPSTGPSGFVLDTITNTASEISSVGATFDRFVVPDNSRAFALSTSAGKVYLVNLPSSATGQQVPASEFTFGTIGVSNLRDLAVSNELPSARFLFLNIGGTLQRFDFGSGTLSGQVAVSTSGPLVFSGTTNRGEVITVLQYGNNQIVPAGQPSLPVVIRVLDPTGRPLANVPIAFQAGGGATLQAGATATSIDGYAAATVTPPAAAATGTVIPVTAVVGPGALANFTITVGVGGGTGPGPSPGAGRIEIVAGQGQLIAQNQVTLEPLTVRLTDADGNPLPNQTVTWSIVQGEGTIVQSSITDEKGEAQAQFVATILVQPGSPYVQTQVLATSPVGSATFFVTTLFGRQNQLPDPPVILLDQPASRSLQGRQGETQVGAIRVRAFSLLGAPIPNVGVRIMNDETVDGPRANCRGIFALTDATGVATCDVVFGGRTGTTGAQIAAGGFNFPISVTVTSGGPTAVLVISGDNQSGNAGTRLQQRLTVEIQANGLPVPNQSVTWEVPTPGSVTLSSVENTTNAQGRASAVATLGNIPGLAIVRVRAGDATGTFRLTINAGNLRLTRISGDAQSAGPGQGFAQPLIVQVTDETNAPVPNTSVAFSVISGTATLSSTSAVTDAGGRASVTATAGNAPGAITVSATAGGQTVTFNLTTRTPGPVLSASNIVNGASFQPGISPGVIATIRGAGIAPSVQGVVVPASVVGPLPTRLAGIEVLFNGVLAPIYSVSNINNVQQVTVQVPFEVNPGTASVQIRVEGGGSTTVDNVPVQPVAPGIFEFQDVSNRRYAVVVRPDGSFVTSSNPARRGERLVAYATGLGQTTPATGTNRVGIADQRVMLPVIVGLNNEGIGGEITAIYVPGSVGVYAIAFTVPENTATGPNQPFAIALETSPGQLVFAQGSALPVQ